MAGEQITLTVTVAVLAIICFLGVGLYARREARRAAAEAVGVTAAVAGEDAAAGGGRGLPGLELTTITAVATV